MLLHWDPQACHLIYLLVATGMALTFECHLIYLHFQWDRLIVN